MSLLPNIISLIMAILLIGFSRSYADIFLCDEVNKKN